MLKYDNLKAEIKKQGMIEAENTINTEGKHKIVIQYTLRRCIFGEFTKREFIDLMKNILIQGLKIYEIKKITCNPKATWGTIECIVNTDQDGTHILNKIFKYVPFPTITFELKEERNQRRLNLINCLTNLSPISVTYERHENQEITNIYNITQYVDTTMIDPIVLLNNYNSASIFFYQRGNLGKLSRVLLGKSNLERDGHFNLELPGGKRERSFRHLEASPLRTLMRSISEHMQLDNNMEQQIKLMDIFGDNILDHHFVIVPEYAQFIVFIDLTNLPDLFPEEVYHLEDRHERTFDVSALYSIDHIDQWSEYGWVNWDDIIYTDFTTGFVKSIVSSIHL